MESVLKRGEHLDDIVSRSEELSASVRAALALFLSHLSLTIISSSPQSKMFYKQAKKTNSCCTAF
jgi:hypothetical protein